jgi:hypothetical protein
MQHDDVPSRRNLPLGNYTRGPLGGDCWAWRLVLCPTSGSQHGPLDILQLDTDKGRANLSFYFSVKWSNYSIVDSQHFSRDVDHSSVQQRPDSWHCFLSEICSAYPTFRELAQIPSSGPSMSYRQIYLVISSSTSSLSWTSFTTTSDSKIQIRISPYMCLHKSRVEAGSNTSTVALRVVGGDEKGTHCLGL